MVSALVYRSSGPVLSPIMGHCVVFLDKTLNFHSASLSCINGYCQLNAGGTLLDFTFTPVRHVKQPLR